MIRRLGTPLPGLTRKTADRRPAPPGVHGATRRRHTSDHRRRLEEKQKLRFHYGVSEVQLRRYFAKAGYRAGGTGGAALELLERRLDNVVFRLGFAPTIRAARQLIVHGHIRVNRQRVSRPGYLAKPSDEISVAPRARRIPAVADSVARGPEVQLPGYLELDAADPFAGQVVGRPARKDVPIVVAVTAVVEFYAR